MDNNFSKAYVFYKAKTMLALIDFESNNVLLFALNAILNKWKTFQNNSR